MDTTTTTDGKIVCRICGRHFKALPVHLNSKHGITADDYRAKFPDAPILADGLRDEFNPFKNQGKATATASRAAANALAAEADDIHPVDPDFENDRLYFGSQSLKIRKADDHPFIPKHDPGYVVDPNDERLEVIAYCIRTKQALYLVGDTGCGKTSLLKEVAAMVNQPIRHISLSHDTDGSHFIGEDAIDVKDGAPVTTFKPGILIKAMIEGSWLICDEMDAASSGTILCLQQILNDGYFTVPNTGEIIVPHKLFRILATGNTVGKGEGGVVYDGTHILNEASIDRFRVYRTEYPSEEVEVEILKKLGVDPKLASKMVKIARDVRQGFKNEDCACTFSTRKLIAWGRSIQDLKNFKLASKLSVLDRLTEDRDFVDGVIQRHIPGSL